MRADAKKISLEMNQRGDDSAPRRSQTTICVPYLPRRASRSALKSSGDSITIPVLGSIHTRWSATFLTPGIFSAAIRMASRSRSSVSAPERLRSEEHTSELQSRRDLVCRLLLEKKKKDR